MYNLITDEFNVCIKHCYFTNCFKITKVIQIHKKGKNEKLPSSYRPISLFEKNLHKRIKMFTDDNAIINEEHYGFRKQHSTIHQTQRIVT